MNVVPVARGETRTLCWGDIAIDLAGEFEGEEVLDGVEDGGGGDDELPSGEEGGGEGWDG
jgi:hypothetical protein